MRLIIASWVFCISSVSLSAAAPKETPEIVAKGKTVFDSNCALCHGEGGDMEKSPTGKAMNARNLSKDQFKAGDTSEKIFETVSKGLTGTAMAAFGHIPEADRWAVAYYIKSLRKPAGKPKKK